MAHGLSVFGKVRSKKVDEQEERRGGVERASPWFPRRNPLNRGKPSQGKVDRGKNTFQDQVVIPRQSSLQLMHVVESKKNGKENETDLHGIENCFPIELWRIFVFVQKKGDRIENGMKIEEKAHAGELRRF